MKLTNLQAVCKLEYRLEFAPQGNSQRTPSHKLYRPNTPVEPRFLKRGTPLNDYE